MKGIGLKYKMKIKGVLGILLVSISVAAVSAKTTMDTPNLTTLSLQDCIDLLMTNNTTMTSFAEEKHRAALNLKSIEEAYHGDLSLSLISNYRDDSRGDRLASGVNDNNALDDPESSQAPILDDRHDFFAQVRWTAPWWHKQDLKVSAAVAKKQLNESALEKQQQEMAFINQATAAYFEVVLNEELYKIHQGAVFSANARYEQIKTREKLGKSSEWEVMSEQSNILSARREVLEAEAQLFETQKSLEYLVNAPIGPDAHYTDRLDFKQMKVEVESYIDDQQDQVPSFEKHPKIRALDSAIEQSEIRLKGLSQKWKPKASIQLLQGLDHLTDNKELKQTQVIAIMELPLPDLSEKRSEIAVESAQQSALFAQKQRVLSDLDYQWRSWLIEIEQLSQQLWMLEAMIRNGLEEEKSAAESYRVGKLTILDLHQITLKQVDFKKNYYQKLYEMQITLGHLNTLRAYTQ